MSTPILPPAAFRKEGVPEVWRRRAALEDERLRLHHDPYQNCGGDADLLS
jgi:hypothetical protein